MVFQCPECGVSVSGFLSGRGPRPNSPISPIRDWGRKGGAKGCASPSLRKKREASGRRDATSAGMGGTQRCREEVNTGRGAYLQKRQIVVFDCVLGRWGGLDAATRAWDCEPGRSGALSGLKNESWRLKGVDFWHCHRLACLIKSAVSRPATDQVLSDSPESCPGRIVKWSGVDRSVKRTGGTGRQSSILALLQYFLGCI